MNQALRIFVAGIQLRFGVFKNDFAVQNVPDHSAPVNFHFSSDPLTQMMCP